MTASLAARMACAVSMSSPAMLEKVKTAANAGESCFLILTR
jgi:hypothetical protein